ncbi:MAG: PilT/PilU family type 4a pilus ATPase [Verrucomicrobiales bacterium]|nr:PilT/PilU family type 4a pilus ATPase [Verrucomicrobiales bacterium]
MASFRDIVDYLTLTRQKGGSDLHLTVGAPPAARVNGALEPLEEQDLDPPTCKEMVMAVLTETQRAKLEKDWELDFAVNVSGVGRFRSNAHYCKGNVEAAFRFIPHEIPELRSLGHGQTVENFCRIRQGLILVTGMTGMGKTTTLAAMARRISEERSCVVITIEDPIEYVFDHNYGLVKQRQIGQDSHSFAAALRGAMRQDPDVIIVSEMRDLETIQAAITAAETGHLVISTLHTIDAAKAFDRIVDVFPSDQQQQIVTQLANSLEGVISQILIPRADQPGRVMATEVLVANMAIRTAIRERRVEQVHGLMQIGANVGMHTFDDSLAHLLIGGYISREEALAHARDKEFVMAQLQNALRQQRK